MSTQPFRKPAELRRRLDTSHGAATSLSVTDTYCPPLRLRRNSVLCCLRLAKGLPTSSRLREGAFICHSTQCQLCGGPPQCPGAHPGRSGCCDRPAQADGLHKQRTFAPHGSGGWKSKTGCGTAGFSGTALRLVTDATFSLCPHMEEGEPARVPSAPHKGADPNGAHPHGLL